MSSECVFCKIISGEIPSAKVFEDDGVVAFLDIAPVNPGHVLVVPKRHVETLIDLSAEEAAACISAARDVARAVLAATGWRGFNLLQNNGSCAGQVVPHCHFHVIPRDPDDGMRFGWRHEKYDEGKMEEMRRKVADEMGGSSG